MHVKAEWNYCSIKSTGNKKSTLKLLFYCKLFNSVINRLLVSGK